MTDNFSRKIVFFSAVFKNHPKRRYCKKPVLCFLAFLLIIIIIVFSASAASGAGDQAAGKSYKVRVGSELDFPPYAFTDENRQPAGFSVELIKAVADAMGLPIRISTGTWDTVWNALVAGQLDVLPVVAKMPERQRIVDFSIPHTETFDAFFVRNGEPAIKNIAAAQGKEIAVMRSDAAHHELLSRNFQGKIIVVNTIPEGLSLITSGKHDAFLCSKLIGNLIIKKRGIKNLTSGPIIPDYKRVFSFAVKKGDTDLLEKLNQGLLIVKTNGEYERIYNKWLSFDDPWRKYYKYFWPAAVAFITLVLIMGLWLITLTRLVNKRTIELAKTNEALLHSYENLELRVAERTTDLAQANRLLEVEISQRKNMELKVKESLAEKEVLLKEIHHRVKNNFQIIISLLNLQAREIENEKIMEIFRECQSRIMTMSSIHSILYESENLSSINFEDFLQELTANLFRSYSASAENISLLISAKDILLDINTAIPCSLIINELLSNALKYAFPGSRKGTINISMLKMKDEWQETKGKEQNAEVKSDLVELIVADDGVGFPINLDFRKTETMGLQLVNMLVEQLDGSIEMYRENGTRFVIMIGAKK